MRKSALIAGAALAATGSSVAFAQKQQGLDASMSPTVAGSTERPRNASLSIVLTTPAPPPGQQFATDRAVIRLPRGVRFNGARFPNCTAARLQASGPSGCPAASRVGSGSADAVALNGQINAALTITAFNARSGRGLLLHVTGAQPIQINSVIEGTLRRTSGSTYGGVLDVPLPANLKNIAGAQPTLTRFAVRIRATRTVRGRRVGFVQTTGCPGGRWRFRADLTFTDGQTGRGTDSVRCRRR